MSILYRAVAETPERLARGVKLRAKMHEQIQAGIKPEGYRPDWIKAAAMNLIKSLAKSAQDFNAIYTDDRISANDLMDVVQTAVGFLKKKSES